MLKISFFRGGMFLLEDYHDGQGIQGISGIKRKSLTAGCDTIAQFGAGGVVIAGRA